jgi:hypothetical protein
MTVPQTNNIVKVRDDHHPVRFAATATEGKFKL